MATWFPNQSDMKGKFSFKNWTLIDLPQIINADALKEYLAEFLTEAFEDGAFFAIDPKATVDGRSVSYDGKAAFAFGVLDFDADGKEIAWEISFDDFARQLSPTDQDPEHFEFLASELRRLADMIEAKAKSDGGE